MTKFLTKLIKIRNLKFPNLAQHSVHKRKKKSFICGWVSYKKVCLLCGDENDEQKSLNTHAKRCRFRFHFSLKEFNVLFSHPHITFIFIASLILRACNYFQSVGKMFINREKGKSLLPSLYLFFYLFISFFL